MSDVSTAEQAAAARFLDAQENGLLGSLVGYDIPPELGESAAACRQAQFASGTTVQVIRRIFQAEWVYRVNGESVDRDALLATLATVPEVVT